MALQRAPVVGGALVAAVAMAVALLLASIAASAAPRPENEAERAAMQALLEGRELSRNGHTREACARFEAALALTKDESSVLSDLAACHERMGMLSGARDEYLRLSSAGDASGFAVDYQLTVLDVGVSF